MLWKKQMTNPEVQFCLNFLRKCKQQRSPVKRLQPTKLGQTFAGFYKQCSIIVCYLLIAYFIFSLVLNVTFLSSKGAYIFRQFFHVCFYNCDLPEYGGHDPLPMCTHF